MNKTCEDSRIGLLIEIISVKESPEYKDRAIKYFQSKWASENSMKVYEDCITNCVTTTSLLPQWYLLMDKDKIIGCAGLITNDFISRMDLYPWVCALYIEEQYRGNGYGSLLLEKAKIDSKKSNFPHLYLCTDHIGYYEKYGFQYIGTGYHPWGESSRIYAVGLNSNAKDDFIVSKVDSPDEKVRIVSETLLGLPEWFGLPESTKSYIQDSRNLPLWVAKKDEEIIGFITLKESSIDTAELHCMGVKKEYHRKGIGKKLYNALEQYAMIKYKYLQVKTVDEGHYKEYDQTISFYKSVGFSKLEVFPTLWDEWNPCLIMVKTLLIDK
ncbi:MAG: GNAT family N-acetyltransferase [Tissierellaceae bacterium]|nr:GNAT family N-acetyltransferase [Tissierellaceae bacterium]